MEFLDLVTNEELHELLVRAVLQRQKPNEVDSFVASHKIESKVAFRDLRLADGSLTRVAAVSVVATPSAPAVREEEKK